MDQRSKIDLDDLYRLLRDEDTTPAQLRPYFKLNEADSHSFSPVVTIDTDAVDLGADEAALAIASFTISINLIVDDISAQSGGSLAKKMV